MVTELNEKTFASAIKSATPVIVDFWASWCMPCRMLTPIFDSVSKQFTGKLKFAKISTEDYPDVSNQMGITGIPCLIVFQNGKEVDRIIGYFSESSLKSKIEEILSDM